MPKSDLLYFVTDNNNGRALYTLDPLTLETRTVAENLPKENFHISPDEKSMFFFFERNNNHQQPGGD